MKKIFSIIFYAILAFLLIFTIKSNAASLDTIDIKTDKQTVHPEENVTLNIEFGQALGSYTFDIAYDNRLFEYVSANGGTANDTGTKVRVYYFDQTGGSTPRSNMSVTFKAKAGITTSNQTNFSITAEGLANSDASVTFDDITTPIIKNVVVEPVTETPEETPEQKPEETPTQPKPTEPTKPEQTETAKPEQTENLPEELPKTGYNIVAISSVIMIVLAGAYVRLSKKS